MTFEDEFSEKQKDMLGLALEYSQKVRAEVEYIYIYASFETMYAFDIFYKTNSGQVKMMHQLPIENLSEDQLDELIFSVLKLGNQDLQEIHSICKRYNQPMPTQITLIYDNINNKIKGTYSYEEFYSNSDTLTADDIFNQWFEEVKAEVEGGK